MTRTRGVLVLVLTAALAAACSKSKSAKQGGDPTPTPTPTSTPTPTPTATPPAGDPIVGSWVNAQGQGFELAADGTARPITGGKDDDLEAKCKAAGFTKVVEDCAKITWRKGPSAYFLQGGSLSAEGMDSADKPESLHCECTKVADLEVRLSGDTLEMWEAGKMVEALQRR